MYRATTTSTARTSTRARACEPDGRARSTDARSRANLVRVTPCVGEIFRAECLGVVSRPSDEADDDADVATSRDETEDASETRAMARRVFFATNALGAMAAATTTMDGVANAFEEVPKDYAKLAREVVETLSASLEYEAANANAPAPPSEAPQAPMTPMSPGVRVELVTFPMFATSNAAAPPRVTFVQPPHSARANGERDYDNYYPNV